MKKTVAGPTRAKIDMKIHKKKTRNSFAGTSGATKKYSGRRAEQNQMVIGRRTGSERAVNDGWTGENDERDVHLYFFVFHICLRL